MYLIDARFLPQKRVERKREPDERFMCPLGGAG